LFTIPSNHVKSPHDCHPFSEAKETKLTSIQEEESLLPQKTQLRRGAYIPTNTLEQVSPPLPLPLPSLLPSPSPSSLPLYSLPLPLEVGPLIADRGSGGAL